MKRAVKTFSEISELYLGLTQEGASTMSTDQRPRGEKINRLNQAEYFRLYRWLDLYVPTAESGLTRRQVAVKASSDLKLDVTEWHIKTALEVTGLKLPEPPRSMSADEKLRMLAGVVERLWAATFPTSELPDDPRDLL